ncbi:hypothetical protein DSM14862_03774 (plasmid) [Sulfitobacter indolifex]|nr:hypothetical protein DSM14862_03333 [Sulfitobacter indolifex]UOA20936.1 hypothetical protein DSM14862_03774 [Sulfitobacter indolifex]
MQRSQNSTEPLGVGDIRIPVFCVGDDTWIEAFEIDIEPPRWRRISE